MIQRLRSESATNSGLRRAVGVRATGSLRVVDCTAGWGRDAVSLAAAGCGVKLLEREPAVAGLLRVLLLQAELHPPLQEASLARRLQVQCGGATSLLESVSAADVLYADPLFPARGRSSLAGAPVELLRALSAGERDEGEELPSQLLAHAQRLGARLVLKRSRRGRAAGATGARQPDFSVRQNAITFDVWLPR